MGKGEFTSREGKEEMHQEVQDEMNGHLNGVEDPMNESGIDGADQDEGVDEEAIAMGAAGPLPKGHRTKLIERINDILSAQQMALELLTNVCSAADEWEDDDDDNSSSSSDCQLDHAESRESISLEEESCIVLPSEVRQAL